MRRRHVWESESGLGLSSATSLPWRIKAKLLADDCALLRLITLVLLALFAISFYMFEGIGPRPDFVLPRRALRVVSMVLVAAAVAYSSVVFQTITANRILTPSVIGFEAIYMFIQTVIVFSLGGGSFLITGTPNFLVSVAAMMVFSLGVYQIMFRLEGQNIYFILLVGMVLGIMFGSLTTFMQMTIDPSEFFIIQNRVFASFNAVNQYLITIAAVSVGVILLLCIPLTKYLDVMALGREHSMSLGVNHLRLSRMLLIVIAVLVAVSTALVGPVTFLGVLVTNLTYQFMRTYKHRYILPACIAVTTISLVGGQYLVSRVFNFGINLSVVINFVGGIYFMYLLLKESR